jgi:hypothetical protein
LPRLRKARESTACDGSNKVGTHKLENPKTKLHGLNMQQIADTHTAMSNETESNKRKQEQEWPEDEEPHQHERVEDDKMTKPSEVKKKGWEREVKKFEKRMKNPNGIRDLYRQLSLPQMKALMEEYGPEDIDRWSRKKTKTEKEDSIRRRFKRWNPNFFDHFEFNNTTGQWFPKLGETEEKERRSWLRERCKEIRMREKNNKNGCA